MEQGYKIADTGGGQTVGNFVVLGGEVVVYEDVAEGVSSRRRRKF